MSLKSNHSTTSTTIGGWSELRWKIISSMIMNHHSHTFIAIGKYSVAPIQEWWPRIKIQPSSTNYKYSRDRSTGSGGSNITNSGGSSSRSSLPPSLQQQSPLHPNDGSGGDGGIIKSNNGSGSGSSSDSNTTPPSSSISSNDELRSSPQETTTSKSKIDWASLFVELALSVGLAIVTSMMLTFLSRTILKGIFPSQQSSSDPSVDDTTTSETQVYRRLKQILIKRSGNDPQVHKSIVVPVLTLRELQMADEIIDPDDIECTFADIGGLDSTKQEIYELAIVPLLQPHLFPTKSKLIQPVKGVLLYGKPGTGKTMMAKALAKESCAIFLPLQLSKILNKYWGESNKLIAATFSLAHKLQPAVIFIDELDTFLKNSNSETAYMDSIKAEFLTLWDGIATTSQSRVLVLGATNKPQHIDSAILRRMPRAFEVPLPDAKGRLAILQLLLKDENIDDTVLPALPKLVDVTKGYSGSDLKELCKAAAMVAVQEHTAEFARRRVMGEPDSALDDALEQQIRPITEADLIVGLQKVRRTGEAAYKYGKQSTLDDLSQRETNDDVNNENNSIDVKALQNIAKLFRALSSVQVPPNGDNEDIPDL